MNPSLSAFSTVTESSGFQSLRQPWNALWESLEHPSLFSSFDWCWSTWRLVAERRGYRLRLVCGWLDGRLVLAWPMIEDSGVLRMLTSDTFEYRGIIVGRPRMRPDGSKTLGRMSWRRRPPAPFLPEPAAPNALSAKLAQMPNAKPIGGGWSPLVRLDRFADWDAYASTLPRSLVSDQRRQWKRVRQVMPEIAFRLVDSADTIEPVIDWISAHKVAWGEARGKRGWFNSVDNLVLLKSVAKSALNDGRLVLATLSDGETTISAGWGYVCGPEFLFMHRYDKAYGPTPSRFHGKPAALLS